MKEDRFNPISNPLPIDYFIDFTITSEAENAFYFLANLMYDDYAEDEVKNIFESPEALAKDVAHFLNEPLDDVSSDYRKSLQAISCVLFTYFATNER